MGETTLIHLSRMIALQRKLDMTAQNVANADTGGFRARQLSFQEYLKPEKGVDDRGKKERAVSLVDPRFQFNEVKQGALQQTGNPLDLAIDGEGYFVVQTAEGERYTRVGALTIDSRGGIVTLAGQAVLWKNGPLQGPLNEGDVNVSADGTIATKRAVFGQLRLVRFARPELLQPAGGTLLRSDQPLVESSGEVRVVSGAIEKSNVQTMREMGRLAEITRSYEMVGRLLKNSQDVDDINKLGNVPD